MEIDKYVKLQEKRKKRNERQIEKTDRFNKRVKDVKKNLKEKVIKRGREGHGEREKKR